MVVASETPLNLPEKLKGDWTKTEGLWKRKEEILMLVKSRCFQRTR